MTFLTKTAFIVAAGQGLRLRPLTTDLPKGLIEVGGMTLLERSFLQLIQAGVEQVVLAVGYQADQIKRYFGSHYQQLHLSYVVNEQYADTGSMSSLIALINAYQGDFLLLESDLLYEARALEALACAKFADGFLVAEPSGSGDEVFVLLGEQGRVRTLGKQAKPIAGDRVTELVGLSKFSNQFAAQLLDASNSLKYQHWRLMHYEDSICEFATAAGIDLGGAFLPGLNWIEIDKQADLERAKNIVYPKLATVSGVV